VRRKSFKDLHCPIARSLEHVGEWWSILILRDALRGATRFEQFQRSLGIAPNMLSRRLGALVEAGLLERRRYSERPPRDEYVLTPRGEDFRPVLWAMLAWGTRHFAPAGSRLAIVDCETGTPVEPVLVDRISGRALTTEAFRYAGELAEETAKGLDKDPTPVAVKPTGRRIDRSRLRRKTRKARRPAPKSSSSKASRTEK